MAVIMPAIPNHAACEKLIYPDGDPCFRVNPAAFAPNRPVVSQSRRMRCDCDVRSSQNGAWRRLLANFLVRVEPCLARVTEDSIGRSLPKCSACAEVRPGHPSGVKSDAQARNEKKGQSLAIVIQEERGPELPKVRKHGGSRRP